MVRFKGSCLMAVLTLVLSGSVLAGPADRSYTSGHSFLTLGGVNCGFLKAVEGGGVVGQVIEEPVGTSYFAKKHLGQPRYQDITLTAGFAMDRSFYEWIAQSWKTNPLRKDGGIVAMDYNLTPKSERQFVQAIPVETTFPALDGASKEPGYLVIKLAPGMTRDVAPGGSQPASGTSAKNEQKMFLPCNFKLQIEGIDCSKVARVDPFTVRLATVSGAIGNSHEFAAAAMKVEFPNLRLLVPVAGAQPFIDWHKSFVIEGHNDDTREKGGMLTLLSPNLQSTLLRLRLFNVGIVKAQPLPIEANAEVAGKIEVELYVERMELLYGDDAGTATPTTPVRTAPTGIRRG